MTALNGSLTYLLETIPIFGTLLAIGGLGYSSF
jgi:hypothetical protein